MAVAAYECTTLDSQLSRLMRQGNTVRVVSLGRRVLWVHVQYLLLTHSACQP
jgi:hypothetical protein